jgi:hypothetical protein
MPAWQAGFIERLRVHLPNARMSFEDSQVAFDTPPLLIVPAGRSLARPSRINAAKCCRPMLLEQSPISQSFMAQTRRKCLSLLQFRYSLRRFWMKLALSV